MKHGWRAALAAAALAAGFSAQAHDLTVVKRVNGESMVTVSRYPTTLTFGFEVKNAHPSLPSELLDARDNLLVPTGWKFLPKPPVTIPVGGSLTYSYDVVVASYEECNALGLSDDDPATPNSEVSFTNTFSADWDSGTAQSSVRVDCRPVLTSSCDDTLYLSVKTKTEVGTSLNILEGTGGGLQQISKTSVSYTALGFNHLDNYLYALRPMTKGATRLVRIGADGEPEDRGALPALGGGTWSAGAFTPDGKLLAYDRGSHRFAVIDVDICVVVDVRAVLDPSHFDVADWAISPRDGKVYGYNSATGRLTRFDPATGGHTDFGPPAPLNSSGMYKPGWVAVAVYFDLDGNLYLCGPDLDLDIGVHIYSVYKVNLDTCLFIRVKVGVEVNIDLELSGGASCAPPHHAGPGNDNGHGRPPRSPTRGEGFFKTHEKPLAECLDRGAIELGAMGRVTELGEALGMLWASPTVRENGQERSELERDQVRLARQVLVATCNERLFGSNEEGGSALAEAQLALQSSGGVMFDAPLTALKAANDAGERLSLPPDFDEGPATPVHAAQSGWEPSPRK